MRPPAFVRPGGPGSGLPSSRLLQIGGVIVLVVWIVFAVQFGLRDTAGASTKKTGRGGSTTEAPLELPPDTRGRKHRAPDSTDVETETAKGTPTTAARHGGIKTAKPRPTTSAAPTEEETLAPVRTTKAAQRGTRKAKAETPEGRDVPRRNKVIAAIKHSWDGYKRFGFGYDEFSPKSRRVGNWGGGRGVGTTIADALDTLLLAGLHEEADEAIDWVENKLSFDQPAKLSVFETTIRIIGGLVSAYQITGRKRILEQVLDLGRRLFVCFDTSSGLPDNYVNLQTRLHEGASWNGGQAILSELGSLQMEFASLGYEAGYPEFGSKSREAIARVQPHCGDGYCPRFYSNGHPTGGNAGLGSFVDSFYEYLLKMWILGGKTDKLFEDMWQKAAEHTLRTSQTSGNFYIPNGLETGGVLEHLACFSGGLFALSYIHTKNQQHLEAAIRIGDTCHEMYAHTKTGLAADVVRVSGNFLASQDPKYILRPETVETYFYLYRVTKDEKYRKWGEDVLDAINLHLKVEAGYVGSMDVNQVPTPHNDLMETFWFAETLKYLLLLFSEDEALDLTKWVINTEAHPLRVVKGGFNGLRKRESEDPREDDAAPAADDAAADEGDRPSKKSKGGKKQAKNKAADDE